jgi:iron complex transport system substrate-binding protein
MVHFAGADDTLVGVTHECDYPPGVEKLPKLTSTPLDSRNMTSAEIDAAIGGLLKDEGSIYALNAELLRELSPDLVITQGLCDVCAVSMGLVEEAVSGLPDRPEVISLNPASIGDVLGDTVRIGQALGRAEEAEKRVVALEERLARVEGAVSGLARPRVACIEWLDPPFSAGHWVPEMVRLAGGEEVFAGPGERSARLTWDEVLAADPDFLVLMPCGFDTARAAKEARRLTELPGWTDLRTVRQDRVWAVDANSYFSRPAPRLVDGVEVLARILHPDAFSGEPGPPRAVRFDSAHPGVSPAAARTACSLDSKT